MSKKLLRDDCKILVSTIGAAKVPYGPFSFDGLNNCLYRGYVSKTTNAGKAMQAYICLSRCDSARTAVFSKRQPLFHRENHACQSMWASCRSKKLGYGFALWLTLVKTTPRWQHR
ncbi:unnamed protein product [Ixodes pacificus]